MISHREAALLRFAAYVQVDREREDYEQLHGRPSPDLHGRTVEKLDEALALLARHRDRLSA